MFRTLYLSLMFHILLDLMIKSSVKKLRVKWRSSFKSFKICTSTLALRMLFLSSGSTTTYFDFSLPEYDSFIYDLSIDPFPPVDRSDSHHEEFADELAHIISLSEYDRFYFDLEIVPGEFTRVLKENIFDLLTKGLKINELNNSPLLLYDCDSSLSKEFFEIDLLVSFPSGNEDISYPLFLTGSLEIDHLTSFPSRNEDKVFNPGILTLKGFHSRYSLRLSHRDSEAFKINKKFKSPMEIFPFFFLYYGGDVFSLDVPYLHFYPPYEQINSGESQASDSLINKRFDCPDFEGSRARCFVHRSLALQILSMLILGIRYP
ncbi:hypothetical protein Tco_0221132 [Tanacetum coccineum]